MDFSLIKYLFAMTDKNIDIISYLKISNVENVFSSFENIFILKKNKIIKNNDNNQKEKKVNNEDKNQNINNNNDNMQNNINNNNEMMQVISTLLNRQVNPTIIRQFMDNYNISYDKNDKKADEYNIIMQWRLLFEMLIVFMKDDSCPYWNLMRNYTKTVFPKTQRELLNNIRKNNFAKKDLENIFKEKIIHEIICQGNLVDLKKLTKELDKYLLSFFEDKNKLNEILEEITDNKLNEETKLFFLKDSCFKYVDINYYFSFLKKTSAQRYILDFKKDIIKPYNCYYYNPSELTFDFFELVYRKVLLNNKNLELIANIIEKLLGKEKIADELDNKSIINAFLPIILNYLSIFAVINTKSFIEFKLKNKEIINKIFQILFNSIENNKIQNNLEKDLEENVKEVINQLNRYQTINEAINNLSTLNKYDYNTEILEKLRINERNSNIHKNIINLFPEETQKLDDRNKKSKNMKNKYKNLMKKKADLFMDKFKSSKEIIDLKDEPNKNKEIIKKSEIMCFYCRNPINMNSFEVPYGKLGQLIEDFFYTNSLKSTIRRELLELKIDDINDIYAQLTEHFQNEKFKRITSCGHYFHSSCFKEGCKQIIIHNNEYNVFTCPLCLKKENILIPPLNQFKEKYLCMKSQNINELIDEDQYIKPLDNKNDSTLINDNIVINFMKLNNLINKNNDYISYLDDIYPQYKSYFTFLENIFYINGTTFNKHQQIDTLQNLNLCLRISIKKINTIDLNQIIKYIKDELIKLAKGPNEKVYIYNKRYMHMHYVNSLEKILLSMSILFDNDEIEEALKYIIYIFIPYFTFGYYYRYLIIKNKNNLQNLNIREKMNMNDLKNYLKDNNKQILNYFNILLKKFALFKLLIDFNNKNDHIINSFNELSIENLLSLLDKDNLYKLLPKYENNEISFIDIINFLPKLFNSNEVFYNLLGKYLDYNKVIQLIFDNIIKYNDGKISIVKELIIHFSPIKFEFTYLDNNIFDMIEKNLGKKCDICNKISKSSCICLICGKAICHSDYGIYHFSNHTIKCGGEYCMFVVLENMIIILWNENNDKKKLFPIYVNEAGIGPKGNEIGNEFNLSHEKLNSAMKNYVCNDLNF